MFENLIQFTAYGIKSHTSTQIWFFKPLWLAVACTCSSSWITVIKWLENHLNVFKRSNDPWNFPIFHMIVVVVHVKHRNFFKAVRGSYLPFVMKHAFFPLETTSLLVSCSGLWGLCVQTFVKHANFFPHHLGGMTLHQPRFHVFWSFFKFLELKCHVTPCLIVS